MTGTRFWQIKRAGVAVGVVGLLLSGASEVRAATIEVSVDRGLLTLETRDAPLEDVLHAIAEHADFRVVIKGDHSMLVTWSFSDAPVADAVRRLLQTKKFVMSVAAGQVTELRTLGASVDSPILPARSPRPGSLVALTKALTDEDPSVRRRAIQDLDGTWHTGARRALGEVLLKDPDPQNRRLAAVTLGRIGGKAAIDAMRSAPPDPNPEVRKAVLASLAQLLR